MAREEKENNSQRSRNPRQIIVMEDKEGKVLKNDEMHNFFKCTRVNYVENLKEEKAMDMTIRRPSGKFSKSNFSNDLSRN